MKLKYANRLAINRGEAKRGNGYPTAGPLGVAEIDRNASGGGARRLSARFNASVTLDSCSHFQVPRGRAVFPAAAYSEKQLKAKTPFAGWLVWNGAASNAR